MILKILRESLGQIIVIINRITLPRKIRRSQEEQEQVNKIARNMSLYQFKRCPFCVRTRRTIHRLNLPIEYRDASQGSPHREELEAGGGQIKVPCLCIDENGKTQWLYESADIIAYLNNRFDNKTSTTSNS